MFLTWRYLMSQSEHVATIAQRLLTVRSPHELDRINLHAGSRRSILRVDSVSISVSFRLLSAHSDAS